MMHLRLEKASGRTGLKTSLLLAHPTARYGEIGLVWTGSTNTSCVALSHWLARNPPGLATLCPAASI